MSQLLLKGAVTLMSISYVINPDTLWFIVSKRDSMEVREWYITNKCMNFPKFGREDVIAVRTFDNCLALYTKRECRGTPLQIIYPTKQDIFRFKVEEFGGGGSNIKSYRRCPHTNLEYLKASSGTSSGVKRSLGTNLKGPLIYLSLILMICVNSYMI